MTTRAQMESNKRNAQRSTGPRTKEGREKSRQNALKHGLTGEGVVLRPRDSQLVEEMLPAYRHMFKPANLDEEWQLRVYVIHRVKLDHAFMLDEQVRADEIERELFNWVPNREAEASRLGMKIHEQPEYVAKQLETTMWGSYWLRDRWYMLRGKLAEGLPWDEADQSLAMDLLGVAHELRRPGSTIVHVPEGEDPITHWLDVVDEQLAYIEARAEGPLMLLDEAMQKRVLNDKNQLHNPELKALRRMQSALFARLDKARRLLEQKDRKPKRETEPEQDSPTAPPPKPVFTTPAQAPTPAFSATPWPPSPPPRPEPRGAVATPPPSIMPPAQKPANWPTGATSPAKPKHDVRNALEAQVDEWLKQGERDPFSTLPDFRVSPDSGKERRNDRGV